MIWSPSVAKQLDEAVRPFEDTPRDWNDVLARSAETRAGVGRPHVATLAWTHRRVLAGALPAAVIALWLSLVLAFAPGRLSAAGSPSPPEIWKAIATSPSFAGNAEILGIRGEFSESGRDPYGELTVTLSIRAVMSARTYDTPRDIGSQRANWLALTAAAMYENEALRAGRSGLQVITTRIESESPDGSIVLNSRSDSVNVSDAKQAIVAPTDLSSAKERVLTRGENLPNVRSLNVSLLQYGRSAAAEVRVVADDPDAFLFTYPRLSKILSNEFSNVLIGTRLEVYDRKGNPVLHLSNSSLLREGSVFGSRPWASSLSAFNPLPFPQPSYR